MKKEKKSLTEVILESYDELTSLMDKHKAELIKYLPKETK